MTIQERIQQTQQHERLTYTPVFFETIRKEDKEALLNLLRENPQISVFDELHSQMKELVKISHPTRSLTAAGD